MTSEDAFRCFMCTNMEILPCGNHIMYKEDQGQTLEQGYKNKYELD